MQVPIIEARVKNQLKEMGKTQKAMSKEIGFAPEHANRCLKQGMSSDTLRSAIARYLNCPVEYLGDYEETETYLYAYRKRTAIEQRKKTLMSLCLSFGWTGDDLMRLSPDQYKCLVSDLKDIVDCYMK